LLSFIAAVMAALLFVQPNSVTPGYWPLPSSSDSVCSACIELHRGKLTPAMPPSLLFLGRFLDSQATGDFQQPFKTARAESVTVKNGRVYFQIGSAVFAYNEATFFDRLTNREPLVPATYVPVSVGGWTRLSYPVGTFDTFLLFDSYFYAENTPANGWDVGTSDGQRRLFQFDVDDQGFVYLAYSLFGWGIVKYDVPGLMRSQVQVLDADVSPTAITVVKTSDGRYCALVGGGNAITNVYDVTDRQHPAKRNTIRKIIAQAEKNAAMTRIAFVGDGSVQIYDSDVLLSGGAPLMTYPAGSIASDGENFYSANDTQSGLVISKFFLGGVSYARADFAFSISAFTRTTRLHYGDGYLVWSGTVNGIDALRIFKIQNGAPFEIDFANYFQRYYVANSTPGYTTPNTHAFLDSTVSRRGAHTYLIATAYSLGDVYELPPDGYVPPPPPPPAAKCQNVPVGCTCDHATGVITCPPPPPPPPSPVPVGCPPIKPNLNVFVDFNGPKSGCTEYQNDPCVPGEAIVFKATGFNYDFSCAPHSFRWDFGDGTPAGLGQSMAHTYTEGGQRFVNLVVVVNGTSSVITQSVVVSAPPAGRRRAVRP
jgi:PKD domain-containing protein